MDRALTSNEKRYLALHARRDALARKLGGLCLLLTGAGVVALPFLLGWGLGEWWAAVGLGILVGVPGLVMFLIGGILLRGSFGKGGELTGKVVTKRGRFEVTTSVVTSGECSTESVACSIGGEEVTFPGHWEIADGAEITVEMYETVLLAVDDRYSVDRDVALGLTSPFYRAWLPLSLGAVAVGLAAFGSIAKSSFPIQAGALFGCLSIAAGIGWLVIDRELKAGCRSAAAKLG